MSEPLALTDQERVEHAARVFSDLMREHKLAGYFAVAAETHGTHALEIEHAPWLRMAMEVDADGQLIGVRVRSKLDEYLARGLSKDEAKALQKREIEFTINALHHIATSATPMCLVLLEAATQLRKHFDSITISRHVGDAKGKPQ